MKKKRPTTGNKGAPSAGVESGSYGTSKFNAVGRFVDVAVDEDGGVTTVTQDDDSSRVIRFDQTGVVSWAHHHDRTWHGLKRVGNDGYVLSSQHHIARFDKNGKQRWALQKDRSRIDVSADGHFMAVFGCAGEVQFRRVG